MKRKNKQATQLSELSKRIKAVASKNAILLPGDLEALSPKEAQKILYQLREHQIELEIQNEELRRVQKELDDTKAHYYDLFDLAPVGYCTLNEHGLILEANFTFATLLGMARGGLHKQPIHRFILKEDQDIYYLHCRQLMETGKPQVCELRMVKSDRMQFWMNLKATIAQGIDGLPIFRIVLSDITERKQVEEELRIAAIAFECQEGIVVMDAFLKPLRINQAFIKITGYSEQEIQGKTIAFFESDPITTSFYEEASRRIKHTNIWQEELRLRRKNGDDYFGHVTIIPVKDKDGKITHYIGNLIDITNSKRQEEKRLLKEANYRNLLVREVRHRIKNNLQGVIGILRHFAHSHPETTAIINQAIAQVQTISVIYGLQGRAVTSSVRVCELTTAIAAGVESLWQKPVIVEIPDCWVPCIITELEAVPLALILNELISNAVKHSDFDGQVRVVFNHEPNYTSIKLAIYNTGQIPFGFGLNDTANFGTGLELITSLLPNAGVSLYWEQHEHIVVTMVELTPPVIMPDSSSKITYER